MKNFQEVNGIALPPVKGRVRFFNAESGETLYQRDNVICNGISYLFSQMMTSNTSIVSGVWGLAVGAGGTAPLWSPTQQPDPLPTQTAMVSEIKRKALSQIQFIDPTTISPTNPNGSPTLTWTTTVSFQTILNATTDNISTPIRERGLIGGGSSAVHSNMLTAPYFTPAAPVLNSVILINYITIPAFILPNSVNMGIDWILSFA
jgi:hypothetical protein